MNGDIGTSSEPVGELDDAVAEARSQTMPGHCMCSLC